MKRVFCILLALALLTAPASAYSQIAENLKAYNGAPYDKLNKDNSLVYLDTHEGDYLIDTKYFMTAEYVGNENGYAKLKITELDCVFSDEPSELDKVARGCIISYPLCFLLGFLELVLEDPYGYLYVPQTPNHIMHIGNPIGKIVENDKLVVIGEGGWKYEKIA